MSENITIRTDLRPGDLGRMITLHGVVYQNEVDEYGLPFEAFVGKTIAEFVLENDTRGRVWLAERGETLVGCAAMVERRRDDVIDGQLRWVLTSPAERGTGLGKKLVHSAVDYARDQNWRRVFLDTTVGLEASMSIYQKLGFQEVSRETHRLWFDRNLVITMSLDLRPGETQ